MYCTFEQLIRWYITSRVYVSIKELEEEDLIQKFCDMVEEMSPTDKFKHATHREMYDYYSTIGIDDLYFKLHVFQCGDKAETYCTIGRHAPVNKRVHLISNLPIDMESLLAE